MYIPKNEPYDDLFQEILLQIWKSHQSYDPSRNAKFTTWMYRVALNTAINSLRKSKKKVNLVQMDQGLHVLEPDEDQLASDLDQMHAAIDQLEKVEKGIILLYLDSTPYKEIAEIMGISESNVGVRINRIKKKLKSIMKSGYE
ncbi:MAG: RNA polymerase sigma factor [Ekhidna sp.]|nr:RNA polymerase sigma factor [Ekhidna sp.]